MAALPYEPGVTFDGVIDVSHWQSAIDFVTVRATGIRAVLIKATQGATSVDPNMAVFAAGAQAAGLLVGYYHFVTDDAPADQAKNLSARINPIKGAVVMLDWEHNPSGATATANQAADLGGRVTALTGRAPLIYCGRYQISAPHPILNAWPLMLPEYGNRPICPPGWNGWLFHQYTGSGHLNGIAGSVDRSVFAGTEDQLVAWWTRGDLPQGTSP